MNKRQFHKLLALNLMTSAHCSLAYIALGMALSYIFSNSIFVFSFFSGLYLMSMGFGAILVEKIDGDAGRLTRIILWNSLAGVLLANPFIIGIMLVNEGLLVLHRPLSFDPAWVLFPAGMVLTVLIGMVSGAELPLFSKLGEKEHWSVAGPMAGVLTSDYFGAFLGISLFTFLLNPFIGLINSVLLSQTLTLIMTGYVLFSEPGFRVYGKIRLGMIGLALYVCGVGFYRNELRLLIDGIKW